MVVSSANTILQPRPDCIRSGALVAEPLMIASWLPACIFPVGPEVERFGAPQRSCPSDELPPPAAQVQLVLPQPAGQSPPSPPPPSALLHPRDRPAATSTRGWYPFASEYSRCDSTTTSRGASRAGMPEIRMAVRSRGAPEGGAPRVRAVSKYCTHRR